MPLLNGREFGLAEVAATFVVSIYDPHNCTSLYLAPHQPNVLCVVQAGAVVWADRHGGSGGLLLQAPAGDHPRGMGSQSTATIRRVNAADAHTSRVGYS